MIGLVVGHNRSILSTSAALLLIELLGINFSEI